MIADLIFEQNVNRWECHMETAPSSVIQIEWEGNKEFTVYGSIEGMPMQPLLTTRQHNGVIFKLDVPQEMKIVLISWNPIKNAKIAYE